MASKKPRVYKKGKALKADQAKVSAKQAYEVLRVRLMFYSSDGSKITHPTDALTKELIAKHKNVRWKIYRDLINVYGFKTLHKIRTSPTK